MSAKERAKELLAPMGTVFLATNGDDGRPNVRAMSVTKCDGLKTVWMISGISSGKSKELLKDPNCTLYATKMDDTADYLELRLRGSIELLDDAESRAAVWHDAYNAYFPGGKSDPELRVLKFTADSGTLQTLSETEVLSF